MTKKFISILTLILLSPLPGWSADESTFALPADLEKAVLSENWPEVARLAGDVGPNTPAPVRYLKAHAGLYLNQNNDSVLLLLSASGPADIRQWNQWAVEFSRANPTVAISHYLAGDSLARLQRHEDALRALEQGLELESQHPLLLNARGVVLTQMNRTPEARESFRGAITASSGQLADAHANLGAAWIQSGEGAEGAEAAFSTALEINPEFGLAAHGLLCVRLVQGDPAGWTELEAKSLPFSTLDSVMATNIEEFIELAASAHGIDLSASASPGAFLDRTFDGGPGDTLRGSLAGSIARQNRVDNSRLPGFAKAVYGKFQENVRGQAVFDFAERHGSASAASAIDKMPIVEQQAVQSSMNNYSARAQRFSSFNTAVGSVSKVVVGVGATDLTGSPWVGGAAGETSKYQFNNAAKSATARSALVSQTSLAMKAQFGPGSAPPAIPQPANYSGTKIIPGIRAGTAGSTQQAPGGADLSLSQINWDDRGWPFQALYGLVYHPVSSGDPLNSEVAVDTGR